mmetsp:Transcript_4146/g.9638  ORF Transcript_4146/g.9638 Transcript_4146/m.9638 type:complete len:217 (+) Transcript_4146:1095-1745(+)
MECHRLQGFDGRFCLLQRVGQLHLNPIALLYKQRNRTATRCAMALEIFQHRAGCMALRKHSFFTARRQGRDRSGLSYTSTSLCNVAPKSFKSGVNDIFAALAKYVIVLLGTTKACKAGILHVQTFWDHLYLCFQALFGEEIDICGILFFGVGAQHTPTGCENNQILQLQTPALASVLPHQVQRFSVLRVDFQHFPGQPVTDPHVLTEPGGFAGSLP